MSSRKSAHGRRHEDDPRPFAVQRKEDLLIHQQKVDRELKDMKQLVEQLEAPHIEHNESQRIHRLFRHSCGILERLRLMGDLSGGWEATLEETRTLIKRADCAAWLVEEKTAQAQFNAKLWATDQNPVAERKLDWSKELEQIGAKTIQVTIRNTGHQTATIDDASQSGSDDSIPPSKDRPEGLTRAVEVPNVIGLHAQAVDDGTEPSTSNGGGRSANVIVVTVPLAPPEVAQSALPTRAESTDEPRIPRHHHSQYSLPPFRTEPDSRFPIPMDESIVGMSEQFIVKPHPYGVVCCLQCEGPHYMYVCKDYLRGNLIERWWMALTAGACLNCLKSGHSSWKCFIGPCVWCAIKHNSTLCWENPKRQR